MKILMVCLGNICRSPLAEGILQQRVNQLGLDWIIESAGTNSYHTGEPPHTLSQKVALLNGIDISKQRSRRFEKKDLQNFDKIYAMSDDVIEDMKEIAQECWLESKVALLLNEIEPGSNKSIPDPWYGTEPGYHTVYEMIDKACEKMIENNFAK